MAKWVNFFEDEYRLNFMTSQMLTPYIPFMNGITMGGGVGISVHSKYSMATENTLFAMPETGIGFFPDVGGSHFLSRLRKNLGMYLGLTGARLKGADVVHAGIARHFAYSFDYNSLHNLLVDGHDKYTYTQSAIDYISVPVENLPSFTLEPHLNLIDECFSKNSVEEIVEALKQHSDNPFAVEALQMIERASPLSLKIAFKQIRNGATLDLLDCLKQEFNIAQNMVYNDDFYTGVKATLITKQRNSRPEWKHASIHDVTDAEVDKFFEIPEGGRPFEAGPGVTVRGRGWRRLLNKKFVDPHSSVSTNMGNPAYTGADAMTRVSGSTEFGDEEAYLSQAAYWRFMFSSARFPGSEEYYEAERTKVRSLFQHLDDLSTRTTALNFFKNVRTQDFKKIADNAIVDADLEEALRIADSNLAVRATDVLLAVKSWNYASGDHNIIGHFNLDPSRLEAVFRNLISSTLCPPRLVYLAWKGLLHRFGKQGDVNVEVDEDRLNMIMAVTNKAHELVNRKIAFPPPPVVITENDEILSEYSAKLQGVVGTKVDIFDARCLATIDIDLFYDICNNFILFEDTMFVDEQGQYQSTLRAKLAEAAKTNPDSELMTQSLGDITSNTKYTREQIVEDFTKWLETPLVTANVADVLLPNISDSILVELLRLNTAGDFKIAPETSAARRELNALAITHYEDVAKELNVPSELAHDFAEWMVNKQIMNPTLADRTETVNLHADIVGSWLQEIETRSSESIYQELNANLGMELEKDFVEEMKKEKPIGYDVDNNNQALYPSIGNFELAAMDTYKNLEDSTRSLDCDDLTEMPTDPVEADLFQGSHFWRYIGAFQNFIVDHKASVDIIMQNHYNVASGGREPNEDDIAAVQLPPSYVRRALFAKKNKIPFQIPLRDD